MNASDLPLSPDIDDTGGWKGVIGRDLFTLPLGSLLCLTLAIWLGQTLNVPAVYAKAGSLLQQPAWQIAVATAWIALVAGSLLASIVAGHHHYDGGLFCACLGLAGLSVRMGPSRYALFNASGQAVFLSFAVELVLLFVAIGIAWLLLRRLADLGWLTPESTFEAGDTQEPLDQNLIAVTAQIVIMLLLLSILGQSDRKPQTLGAVGISAYIAALITHHFIVATRPSAWFWVGPLVVGLIGYLGQYINPSGLALGDIEGLFAPLARPAPLDYASLGVAGSLLGYWTSQRWHREREAMEATA